MMFVLCCGKDVLYQTFPRWNLEKFSWQKLVYFSESQGVHQASEIGQFSVYYAEFSR